MRPRLRARSPCDWHRIERALAIFKLEVMELAATPPSVHTEPVPTCPAHRGPGLTPATVLDKLATIQMIDVGLPTTDGRWLILPRFTPPDTDTKRLRHQLNIDLPAQPPPRLTSPLSAAAPVLAPARYTLAPITPIWW